MASQRKTGRSTGQPPQRLQFHTSERPEGRLLWRNAFNASCAPEIRCTSEAFSRWKTQASSWPSRPLQPNCTGLSTRNPSLHW